MSNNPVRENDVKSEKSSIKSCKELSEIFFNCLKISSICKDSEATEKLKTIFSTVKFTHKTKNQSEREIISSKMLEAARMLRYSGSGFSEQSDTAQITVDDAELIIKLYEIAASYTAKTENQVQILQEIVLYSIVAGQSEKFVENQRKLFDFIEDQESDKRALMFAIGLTQMLTDEPEQAEITFRRMLKDFQNSDEGLFGLTISLLYQRQKRKASSLIKNIQIPELLEIINSLSQIEELTLEDIAAAIRNLKNV